MNEIVYKCLLVEDKFMAKMHLKQSGFTYNTCEPFERNREKIQNFKVTGDSQYIYQNELDKACFKHNTTYGDFKDLTRRTASDKIWWYKAFNIAKNPKFDGNQTSLDPIVYTFFDRKTSGSGIKNENMLNKELAEELHKPIIRKFENRKVNSLFIDNILGAHLADMELISKFNKDIMCY